MAVTKTGTVRCDSCGRFVKDGEWTLSYTPDSSHSREQIWHYCRACTEDDS